MDPQNYLNQHMQQEGEKYGFTSVGAEFSDFRNLVVRWRRTNRWIRVKVSDYLMDAPEGIIDSLVELLFKQITGKHPRYPKDLMAWLTDPSFCLRKRETFMSRNPSMTGKTEGVYRDLKDSYRRLIDAGLVEDDPDIHICWNTTVKVNNPSQYSVLMKTISITDLLDDPTVPDYVVDWLIYHDLCIVQSGYDPYCARRTVPEKIERRYPDMEKAKDFLESFFDKLPMTEEDWEDTEDPDD